MPLEPTPCITPCTTVGKERLMTAFCFTVTPCHTPRRLSRRSIFTPGSPSTPRFVHYMHQEPATHTISTSTSTPNRSLTLTLFPVPPATPSRPSSTLVVDFFLLAIAVLEALEVALIRRLAYPGGNDTATDGTDCVLFPVWDGIMDTLLRNTTLKLV